MSLRMVWRRVANMPLHARCRRYLPAAPVGSAPRPRRVPPELLAAEPRGEPSGAVRERVVRARRRQLERQGCLNAQLKPGRLRQLSALTMTSRRTLERWSTQRGFSARGFQRAWRVARTAADLAASDEIHEEHVLEALGFRLQDAAA